MITASDAERQLEQLIIEEKLPEDFVATVRGVYRPLASDLARRAKDSGHTLIVGVNGAQGTGKSTMSRFLSLLLVSEFCLKTVAFSLDDIYLTKAQRNQLADTVHPLLAVRGVPGTHDIPLGEAVINQLLGASPTDITAIPAFDKAVDDRRAESEWEVFTGRPDVIIVEGWCAGTPPAESAVLATPVNELERTRDPDGRWRHYVNEQLKTDYRRFFSRFEVLIFIAAPSWDLVYQWRRLQEKKLQARCREQGLDDSAVMSPQEVARFLQFYERITRRTLEELPSRADYVLTMDEAHRITAVTGLSEPLKFPVA